MENNQKFTIQHTTGETTIEWKSLDLSALIFFVALIFFIKFIHIRSFFPFIPWQAISGVHLAIYVSSAYYGFAVFINKSKLTITSNEVRLKVGPLPLGHNFGLPVTEIESCFVKNISTLSRIGVTNLYQNRIASYWVVLKNKQGKEFQVYSTSVKKEAHEFCAWLNTKINK